MLVPTQDASDPERMKADQTQLLREVLFQFLIEAVVLVALGGLIGIMLDTGASLALSGLMGVPYLFNPLNLLSFVFQAGIGVVSGYLPAWRARTQRCAAA